jgi:hypothetical protein
MFSDPASILKTSQAIKASTASSGVSTAIIRKLIQKADTVCDTS